MRKSRWRAWLTEAARDVIVDAATAAHPNETGGVLLGVLSQGRPWITAAVEVPHGSATGVYYELAGGAAPAIVDSMTLLDRRLGYLGEWHSHPADVGPSDLDARSMRAIATDAAAGCERPVLIIARRRSTEYELDARQLQQRRLRLLRLIDAGPLLAVGTNSTPTLPTEASQRPRGVRKNVVVPPS